MQFTRLITLQNRAIKILNSANFRDSASPLYKTSQILKISDNIRLQNFLFVYDDLHGKALKNTFELTASLHAYVTRDTAMHKVKSPAVKTTVLRSIKFRSCQDWYLFIHQFKNMSLS